jgi:cysteinyl-tRNA synthetase
MDLRLYDTLARDKRDFVPLDPARVRMYVCGPTVYDFAHIGNARPVIVFDVLFRLLRHLYGAEHVAYVRNITDVDDKINARASERGVPIRELTEETYRNFKQDVAALGCLPPTVEPRATEHIAEMRILIERLVTSGNAYVAEEHVLFSVPSMPDYGQLSRRPLDEMIAGARVDVAPYKRDPMDFVLWKPSKPGEPSWPSPSGIKTPGRPGWHIECSAMSWKHLGESFDIHGGGIDLVFPHHENEIAQSRCAFQSPVMANYWMHNGFLQVEGEKMSKSLGNFVVNRDLLNKHHGQAIRLAMLLTHYRQPLNWTLERLLAARNELSEWATIISNTSFEEVRAAYEKGRLEPDRAVLEALSDDLNTPEAITRLRELYSEAKRDSALVTSLFATCCFLGLLTPETKGTFLAGAVAGTTLLVRYKSIIETLKVAHANRFESNEKEAVDFLRKYDVSVAFKVDGYPILSLGAESPADAGSNEIQDLVDARNAARRARNFKESDRIRDELAAMGIELEDKKDGTTTWRVKR